MSLMAMKAYSAEFKADAVALYLSDPSHTFDGIGNDLGVMNEHGIVGVHLRKPVRTTVPDPEAAVVPDLIRRDFTASAPNTRYVGDIPPSTACWEVPPPTSQSVTVSFCIWRRCWT